MVTAIGAEGVFLVPFTLSMEIVGGKEKVGFLPWVTYKTFLGNRLDSSRFINSVMIGDALDVTHYL